MTISTSKNMMTISSYWYPLNSLNFFFSTDLIILFYRKTKTKYYYDNCMNNITNWLLLKSILIHISHSLKIIKIKIGHYFCFTNVINFVLFISQCYCVYELRVDYNKKYLKKSINVYDKRNGYNLDYDYITQMAFQKNYKTNYKRKWNELSYKL